MKDKALRVSGEGDPERRGQSSGVFLGAAVPPQGKGRRDRSLWVGIVQHGLELVGKPLISLLRGGTESPSLEVFKRRADMALGDTVQRWARQRRVYAGT